LQGLFLSVLDTVPDENLTELHHRRRGGLVYLNVQRAALLLGVAPHTVRRWTASGLLPCSRTPGGHRRFRREDVEALAQQLGGSSQAAARRARERELDTLLETSLALVSRLEPAELLGEIAAQVTRLMDCHFCAISTFDEDSQTVTMLADFDAVGRRLPDTAPYPLARYPLTRRVLEDRVPAVVNAGDPAADPDELRELAREGDKSILIVPLVHAGRSVGLLELVDHARERRYSRQELRICSAIAGQAAVALHNAESFAEARRATRDVDDVCELLEAAAAGLQDLGSAAGVDGLLRCAAQAVCATFGALSCVAAARGQSAGALGAAVPDAASAASAGARPAGVSAVGKGSDGAQQPAVLVGGCVLSVAGGSGAATVTLTVALARPARAGEPRLLDLIAAVVAGHLRRIGPSGG
jgi:excisionase family DNA binding protein